MGISSVTRLQTDGKSLFDEFTKGCDLKNLIYK